MKKIYLLSLFFVFGLHVSAQSFDPTVVVTNTFEAKLSDIHKPNLYMAVPDTVRRFYLNFDYSVFDQPYQGSYIFSPYSMTMKPVEGVKSFSKLHLNLGAGYNLRPVFDIVYSPIVNKKMVLDLYAGHHSFLGKYYKLDNQFKVARDESNERMKYNKFSYDMSNAAGMDFRRDWDALTLSLNAGYNGLNANNFVFKRDFNEADVSLQLYSKNNHEKKFIYSLKTKYSYLYDAFSSFDPNSIESSPTELTNGVQQEHLLEFDFNFGIGFLNDGRMMFDFEADYLEYKSSLNHFMGNFSVKPHYVKSYESWIFDLGFKASYIAPQKKLSPGTEDPAPQMMKGQYVYPAIHVSYAFKNAMKLSFNITGGESMNPYSHLAKSNHFFSYAPYGILSQESYISDPSATAVKTVIDNSVERFNASMSWAGKITTHFSYELSGGYARYKNNSIDHIANTSLGMVYYLAYAPMGKAYANLDCKLEFDFMKLDAKMAYQYTHLTGQINNWAVLPADFVGDVDMTFNWNKRIYWGAACQFASSRKVMNVDDVTNHRHADVSKKIPGYADLSVKFEYQHNRKMSFWLSSANLLCMNIQRTPLYAESGLSFTAGICLNL